MTSPGCTVRCSRVMSLGSVSPGAWPFWEGEGSRLFVHSLLLAVMPWAAESVWQPFGQVQTLGDLYSTPVATLVP